MVGRNTGARHLTARDWLRRKFGFSKVQGRPEWGASADLRSLALLRLPGGWEAVPASRAPAGVEAGRPGARAV